MRLQTNGCWSTLSAMAIIAAMLLSLGGGRMASAQNEDASRRLYGQVIGYEFDETVAKDALAAGADINWKNDAMNGETLLIMAIKNFSAPKVVKFLLDNGADTELKDDAGRTALSWALQYKIGNNRNGREILALLQPANKNKQDEAEKPAVKEGAPAKKSPPAKTKPTKKATTAAKKPRRSSGPPSAEEVKAAIEESFTNTYQNHFFGVKNEVTFEWLGAITVGKPEKRVPPGLSTEKTSYPVRVRVKVTATDPRDGNTSTVERGVNANIAGYKMKETFWFYRNAFGEWEDSLG